MSGTARPSRGTPRRRPAAVGSSGASDFRTRVEAVIAGLAPGEVVTYGEVAAQAGSPGAARAVGTVLRTARVPLPWWRVVGAGGRLVTAKGDEQARRLREEGVAVERGRVRA